MGGIEAPEARYSHSRRREDTGSRKSRPNATNNDSFVTSEPLKHQNKISNNISTTIYPTETGEVSDDSVAPTDQVTPILDQQKGPNNTKNSKNSESESNEFNWKNFRVTKASNLNSTKGKGNSANYKPTLNEQQKIIKDTLKDYYQYMREYEKLPQGSFSVYSFQAFKQINSNSSAEITADIRKANEKATLKNIIAEGFEHAKQKKLRELEASLFEAGLGQVGDPTNHTQQRLNNADYKLYQGLKHYIIKGQYSLNDYFFYHQVRFVDNTNLPIEIKREMTAKAIEWFLNTKFELLQTAETDTEQNIWYNFQQFQPNRHEVALIELSYDGGREDCALELIDRFFAKVTYKIIFPIKYLDINKYEPSSSQKVCYFIVALDKDPEFLPPKFVDLKTKAKLRIINRVRK